MNIARDDGIYGQVYEQDGRFHYHCATCSTSYSGPSEMRIDAKADDHEYEHQQEKQ